MADDKKEVKAGDEDLVVVKFRTIDNIVFQFRIKKNTVLRKAINALCNRLGVLKSKMRFMHCGRHVHSEDSPKSLGEEEEVVIEVYRGLNVDEYNLSETTVDNEDFDYEFDEDFDYEFDEEFDADELL